MKIKSFVSIALLLVMCMQLFACAQQERTIVKTNGTVDLMANIQPLSVDVQQGSGYAQAAANFAVSLLQNAYDGDNCVLSPYSVYTALAMTANGADAETRAQMEDVLGMSAAELNVYLYALAQNAGQELNSANSVWFRQNGDLRVEEDFLQINADYYGADAFAADFDEQTLADINDWISEQMHGMIENALDNIDPVAMLYLINALTFDAEWDKIYHTDEIYDSVFHGADGDEDVQMMCSEEQFYLQDDLASGFIKDYAGGQYSYIAMLPNEGVSMQEYVTSLSGEKLLATVENATSVKTFVTMPKYDISYRTELSAALSAMGMPTAFTNAADFSSMSNLDLKIGRVLHDTRLTVDERGTQAGAVTIVEMDLKGAFFLDSRTVVLDRPFVMGIYDNANQSFVFLGVIDSVR